MAQGRDSSQQKMVDDLGYDQFPSGFVSENWSFTSH